MTDAPSFSEVLNLVSRAWPSDRMFRTDGPVCFKTSDGAELILTVEKHPPDQGSDFLLVKTGEGEGRR